MPKLSLVLPTYTINKNLEELAIRAVLSYLDQVDELIICEDGGLFSLSLANLADVYIYNKYNGGFSVNVNRGWRYATGDYVAIVNSDTELSKGVLDDLCIPGKVTSPTISNQYIDLLAGPFWVAPKEVTKEYGYLMEEMRIYSSDSEYEKRIKHIFQAVPSVEIFHHQSQTVRAAGIEGGEQQRQDRATLKKLQEEGKASV